MKIKRLLSFIFCFLIMASMCRVVSVCALELTAVQVETAKPVYWNQITPQSAAMDVGQSMTFTVIPEPTLGGPETIWSSSNTSVIQVSGSGTSVTVTAVGGGNAKLTAECQYSRDSVSVWVNYPPAYVYSAVAQTPTTSSTPIPDIVVPQESVILSVGDRVSIGASLTDGTSGLFTYRSSNTGVVTVDSSGLIIAVAKGSANVTVTAGNGRSAAVAVTVKDTVVHVTSVVMEPDTVTAYVGDTLTLQPGINPSNAANKAVTFSSSNSQTAKVDSSGTVTALAKGTATITITSEDGAKTATLRVTVLENTVPVQSVALSPTESTIAVGQTKALTATITPDNATNKKVTFSSSDEKAAAVDSSGNVKGLTAGTVTITVTTEDGLKTAAAKITVTAPKSFQVKRDDYSFRNTASSFGYPKQYTIPITTYKAVLGDVLGEYYWNLYEKGQDWGGSCFGFSASSLLFFTNKLQLSSYGSPSSLYSVPAPASPTAQFTALIEKYQVSQLLSGAVSAKAANTGKIAELITAVHNFQSTGSNPIILSIRQDGSGHAIIPFKVSESGGSYTITVYDNNFPGTERPLTINGSTWSYNGGSYTWGSASGGTISFTPISAVEGVTGVTNQTILTTENQASVTLNHKNVESISGAYEIFYEDDTKGSIRTFAVPAGEYTISAPNSKQDLSVSFVSGHTIMDVSTTDSSAAIVANTTSNVAASIRSSKDNTVSITLKSTGTEPILIAGDVKGSFAVEETSDSFIMKGEGILDVTCGDNTEAVVVNAGGTSIKKQAAKAAASQPKASQPPSSEITVTVNGKTIEFDQPPIIINNRTMVPIRFISESLGAAVDWDSELQKVSIKNGGKLIELTIASTDSFVNSQSIKLDAAPQIVGGRTLVPVRFIAEAFDAGVDWDEATRTVIITTQY